MLPVNLKVMEDDGADDPRGLSSDVLEKNSDFRRFTDRMRGMGRTFVIKSKKDPSARIIPVPTDGEDQSADAGKEWLDCCLREYLERKRLFGNKFSSRKRLLLRIATLLVPFLAVLWVLWPLWRVLIDVETDAYYKVLGVPSTATSSEVTRAYRAMMKRWHPDHNPNCGQYCRDQTERIKEAYDMLLSRGEHQFTLANQYHEGLMTLRSTLSFRGFQISGGAAMGIFMVISRLLPAKAKSSTAVRVGCSVLVLLLCTVHETLYVSGFNISTVIGLFYYCVSLAKASAQQRSMEEVMRNSYFDVLRDAAALLGCAGVSTLAMYFREHSSVSVEEVFRMLYGSVYVMAFLYKFAPNIYDNMLMRKYSLPVTYMNMGTAKFTWLQFALSELSFLVDDLFVFTCRVPSPYRIVVYITHFVCLCQFAMLPWDAPITAGKAGAKANTARPKEASPAAAAAVATADAPGKPEPKAAAARAEKAESVAELPIRESPLTKEEEEVVTDLDTEHISWMDIATVKYKSLISTLGRRYTRQQGHNADAVDIASTADVQHVVVFAFGRPTATAAGPGQPKVEILCRVSDPETSRLIAQERGPQMLLPPRVNMPWNLDMARVEYKKALGESAHLTNSQLWRRRSAVRRALQAWQAVLLVALASCVITAVCALFGPSSLDIIRSTKGLDNSLRPQLYARFSAILPAQHFVNALSGGLLTVSDFTFCVLDWWDAGVTLGFIR